MNYKFADMSCVGFSEILASREPVPGGGGASALVGALGVALCSMVGNLTAGRKKYAQYEEDIKMMLVIGEKVRIKLLELIDEDAKAFEPLAKAYSIPKDDPKREEIMEKVLTDACKAPLEMMKCCCEAIELLSEMLNKGSVTLVSDVGCGALFSKAALSGASLNIFINTKSLSNREKAKAIEAEADTMLKKYVPLADGIAEEVENRIRREG